MIPLIFLFMIALSLVTAYKAHSLESHEAQLYFIVYGLIGALIFTILFVLSIIFLLWK